MGTDVASDGPSNLSSSGVMRALMRSGLADIWGETRVPLYVLNVTYPLLDPEIIRFCSTSCAIAHSPSKRATRSLPRV